jgi:hypothetical protein
VRSRHSEKSIPTPTPGPAHRSVSLPVTTSSRRATLLFEDPDSVPLLFRHTHLSWTPSNLADPDDVFGIVSETEGAANRKSTGTNVSEDRESQWIDASSIVSSEYGNSLRSVSLGESVSNNMIRAGYAAANNSSEDDGADDGDGDGDAVFDDLLSSFPVPPMQNPVGTLPMLVTRATLSSDSAAPVSALLESCRSSRGSGAAIKRILEQTRARGDALPVIEWKSISAFERSWRELNEELLVAIYGRQDTWLSAADVAYVDCIGKEFRARPGHWVLQCFREEAEVF